MFSVILRAYKSKLKTLDVQKRYTSTIFSQMHDHSRKKLCAIKSGGYEFSYNDILNDSDNLSKLIPNDFKNHNISFLCPNGYDYVKSMFAIWRSGCVAVPLYHLHPLEEMEYYIQNSKSKLLLCHSQYINHLKPVAERNNIDLIEIKSSNSKKFHNSPNKFELDLLRRALIIYTSGTTGKPKGVVMTHKNLQTSMKSMVEAWEWTSNDHILHCLPLHHFHGIVNALLTGLWSGATVEMLPSFNSLEVWNKFKEDNSINLFMAVPTMYHKLIKEYDSMSKKDQLLCSKGCKKFRLMVSGSMALPDILYSRWEEISGHKLLERYGMTEIGMALTNPYRGERIKGRVGYPFPNVKVKVNESTGELLVSGDQIFLEYFENEDATKNAFDEDGWFKTGDIVEVDENGSFKILGRMSVDILKSAGYKISALEIERVLLDHPNISEVAVVGVDDKEWGQIISAIVVLKDQSDVLTLENLQEWLKDKMAKYKIPRKLLIVDEIPRNHMGKINKKSLLKLFE